MKKTAKESLFRVTARFILAALALSALTFGLVGVNRYFDSVWENYAPGSPFIFTVQGQVYWLIIVSIAVVWGAVILGALALSFPWAVMKGTELVDLWKLSLRRKKQA